MQRHSVIMRLHEAADQAAGAALCPAGAVAGGMPASHRGSCAIGAVLHDIISLNPVDLAVDVTFMRESGAGEVQQRVTVPLRFFSGGHFSEVATWDRDELKMRIAEASAVPVP